MQMGERLIQRSQAALEDLRLPVSGWNVERLLKHRASYDVLLRASRQMVRRIFEYHRARHEHGRHGAELLGDVEE